jgi:hypothetical protein
MNLYSPISCNLLSRVTDLVVETLDDECQAIILEEYFPDLRHLTLRLQPFLMLWGMGAVSFVAQS